MIYFTEERRRRGFLHCGKRKRMRKFISLKRKIKGGFICLKREEGESFFYLRERKGKIPFIKERARRGFIS
jgi:hypothetical protein